MIESQIYPPYIIERSSRGERTYDIFSRLLMDRIVFLGTQINDEVANIIIAQLLFLDADNPERDIYLYVNSPGGLVSSGMAIYDTMQFLRAPVNTICMGMAASMGSLPAHGRPHGQALGAPACAYHDAPALRGHAGHRVRHRDPGPGDSLPPGQAERPVRQAYGQGGGADREGHGPGPLHVGRRSQGIRPHRPRDRELPGSAGRRQKK